jgi:hypothetical protein
MLSVACARSNTTFTTKSRSPRRWCHAVRTCPWTSRRYPNPSALAGKTSYNVRVPRTVSRPLTRAFTVGRPRVVVGSPPSMIASCGVTTRLSDARPGAELAGHCTLDPIQPRRGDPGAPARGRRAPPRQSTPDRELVSCAGDLQETASSALTSCILCSAHTERIVSDKDPVGGRRCSVA